MLDNYKLDSDSDFDDIYGTITVNNNSKEMQDMESFEPDDLVVAIYTFDSSDDPSISIEKGTQMVIKKQKKPSANGNILVDNDDWRVMHWISKANFKNIRKLGAPPLQYDRGYCVSPSGILRAVQVHKISKKTKWDKNVYMSIHYVGYSEDFEEWVSFSSGRYFGKIPEDGELNKPYEVFSGDDSPFFPPEDDPVDEIDDIDIY